MRAKLYLESGSTEHEGGSCQIWILALPGCVAYGENLQQALIKAPHVAQEYLNWLRVHGEPVSTRLELETEPAEIFQVSTLGDYEISAVFGPDFGAPSAEEIERCLRWMRYSRQDLLQLVADLSSQILDMKPKPGVNSIREVLHHVATAEIWYISRLELEPERLSRPEYPKETFALLETTRAWAVEHLQARVPAHDDGRGITTHRGETWTLKKVLRRFLYHETYHRRQIEGRLKEMRPASLTKEDTMSFTLDDLLDGLRGSRRYFLKHLDGLRPEQWGWKPYPECKNIRETLAHLIADDRAALEALQTGKTPNYDALQESERDPVRLRALLDESHQRICEFLTKHYANAPLDREICIWGSPVKLARGVAYLSSEDFYHAGQIAFIRIATDPKWDYYGSIYGG